MILKMFIGNILVDYSYINILWFKSLHERENYLDKKIKEMYLHHHKKIIVSEIDPTFCIDVPSKMGGYELMGEKGFIVPSEI